VNVEASAHISRGAWERSRWFIPANAHDQFWNGRWAWSSFQEQILRLAMELPDINGTEVIEAVKAHQPDAAILAMSGGESYIRSEFCCASTVPSDS